jgi:starch-binding outer membrane protein, SusD/RagB family
MKRFISYTAFLVLIGSISCKKDFLEVPDRTVLVRQAYVTDLKSLGDYLNGVYFIFSASFYTGTTHMYPDIVADNLKTTSNLYLGVHHSWSQRAGEEAPANLVRNANNANGIWSTGYKIARNSSFVIEEVEKYRKENSSKADLIKGQAYTMRALAHFIMVNIFAQSYNFSPDGSHPGIPYIASSDYREAVSRQTVAQVYDGLINDLKNAIQLLPPGITDTRLMNLPAAKALLARAYLFKQDYQSAKNLACEVGSQYPLLTIANDYPIGIFKQLPVTKSESLFQLGPSEGPASGTTGSYSTTFAAFFYSQNNVKATADIGRILKESSQDIRNSWVSKVGSDYNITKYPSGVLPGFSSPSLSYFETLIRSSEMFLTAAESYANLNNEDSARFYLNAIRLRANPSANALTTTGPALLDSIYKERRKELAFEGLRMFDLQRWKQGVVRTDPGFPAAQNLPYPNDKAIAPIPVQDVNMSGLKQNPGY